MHHSFHKLIILTAGIALAAGIVCACGKSEPGAAQGGESGGGSDPEIPVTPITTLKVMSFNILRGDIKSHSDGETEEEKQKDHTWVGRREACLAMIAAQEPMLFGLQECTWTQRRHILGDNALLDAVGVAVNGQESGYTTLSSNPIFWRKDIFELQEWGTFWLSDTPDTPSDTWNYEKKRTCTWASLKVRCNGKRLLYFNAHIENAAGEETKNKSIRLIIDRMRSANPTMTVPMLFGGDLNSKASANCLSAMMTYLQHAPTCCTQSDTGRTFNGFKSSGGSAIDHLFYNEEGFIGMKFTVNREAYKNVTYISDHYPIFCELTFN